MKKLTLVFLLLFVLILSGCKTLPRQCVFPHPPDMLMQPAPELSLIRDLPSYQKHEANEADSGVLLSEVAGVVAENYLTYHEVATTLESLQGWILKQEELINK